MKSAVKRSRTTSDKNVSALSDNSVEASLLQYHSKRDFTVTGEPSGRGTSKGATERPEFQHPKFVVQKHWASRLHYDFRLEINGVMKSWAVPKGPSLDAKEKRLAVEVEDHPIDYSVFEGDIPRGQYGAGRVIIWDEGTWTPVNGDPFKEYLAGSLKFTLHGQKLRGKWALVRMTTDKNGGKQRPWLLIKEKDSFMRSTEAFNVLEEMPESILISRANTSIRESKNIPFGSPSISLPTFLEPQLAVLANQVPKDDTQWFFEIKFDGYRLLTRVDELGKVAMFTRSGNDWSLKLSSLVTAFECLKLPSGWYDGEMVVNNAESGTPDFGALQRSIKNGTGEDILLYLFDVPFYDGQDLRQQALQSRRAVLESCLSKANHISRIFLSQTFDAEPLSLLSSACKLGLEGIMGKRKDSVYHSKRTADWIKLKCRQRNEFVVGGFTTPSGTREYLGALLLGVFDEKGMLHFAGKVGSGFTDKTLKALAEILKPISTTKCPFVKTNDIDIAAHWVEPVLVAEVSFHEWTNAGRLRHAVFHGIRTEKNATSVVRDVALTQLSLTDANKNLASFRTSSTTKLRPRKITHSGRVVDASCGITKGELVSYFESVACLLLVHMQDRPTAVLRAPNGLESKLFFQKHLGNASVMGIQAMKANATSVSRMLHIGGLEGVVSAAQWNVVEFHTSNCSMRSLNAPDRMVFDLDPGEGVAWVQVLEGAKLVGAFLEQLGLKPFLKTSGGNGLHIVVPLRGAQTWVNVKGFSKAIVQHLSAHVPQRFVSKSGPNNRVGKIFIDYLRNAEGATTITPWSARARSGMGISVPVHWHELDQLSSGAHWTVRNSHARQLIGNSPWDGYSKGAHTLAKSMRILGYKQIP